MRKYIFISLAAAILLWSFVSAYKNNKAASPSFYSGTEAPCIVPASWMSEYHFRSNCSGIGRAGSASALMSFNSHGLRDKDYSEVPDKNTYRILLIGASNVLGIGISEDAALARILERSLVEKLKKRVEVINGAVNGYCTWQSAFTLRKLVKIYRPDLVLYNIVFPSCFLTDLSWNDRLVFSKEGEPIGYDRSFFRADSKFNSFNKIYYNPNVFFFLHTWVDSLRRAHQSWRVRLFGGKETEAILSESTRAALNYMNRASREEGAFFVSFFHETSEPPVNHYVPFVMNAKVANFVSHFYADVQTRYRRMCLTLLNSGVPTILLKDFTFEQRSDDGHLTENGTRSWGKKLSEELLKALELRKSKLSDVTFRQTVEFSQDAYGK